MYVHIHINYIASKDFNNEYKDEFRKYPYNKRFFNRTQK